MAAVIRPSRTRWLVLALAAGLGGCATYAPLQTASTVRPGVYRVGGQVTMAPYCTLTLSPMLCTETPRQVTLPELRLSGRTGLVSRVDAGATVHGRFSGGLPLFGLALDAKAEAWSHPVGQGRFLLSGAVGVGGTFGPGMPELPGVTQLELTVPLFAALDGGGSEWLFSPRFVHRIRFVDVTGDPRREALGLSELGFAIGYLSKRDWLWGVQVEYHAPMTDPLEGPLTLTVGLLFDLGAS